MLTIRKEQMEALRRPRLERLYLDLIVHIRTSFAEQSAGMSDEELQQHIRKAVGRASQYQLRSERALYKFVSLSMLYGTDFDQAETTKWMRAILTDAEISSPNRRMDLLYDEVIRRLKLDEKND
jgi:hypothetical protein